MRCDTNTNSYVRVWMSSYQHMCPRDRIHKISCTCPRVTGPVGGVPHRLSRVGSRVHARPPIFNVLRWLCVTTGSHPRICTSRAKRVDFAIPPIFSFFSICRLHAFSLSLVIFLFFWGYSSIYFFTNQLDFSTLSLSCPCSRI